MALGRAGEHFVRVWLLFAACSAANECDANGTRRTWNRGIAFCLIFIFRPVCRCDRRCAAGRCGRPGFGFSGWDCGNPSAGLFVCLEAA